MRQAALDFDIKRLTPSFLDDPFPIYRALREHDPVHRMPDGERQPLRDWSLSILGALEPVLSPEQLQRGAKAVDDFKSYLRALIARRSHEQKTDEAEILSKLIAASELAPGGGSGERLSD